MTCWRPAALSNRIRLFCRTDGERDREQLRFSRIDLNHDLDALKTLLTRERPTHVVNFLPRRAWLAKSWLHPDHWMMTNVVSNDRDCTRCCATTTDCSAMFRVTTPEVYGSTRGW